MQLYPSLTRRWRPSLWLILLGMAALGLLAGPWPVAAASIVVTSDADTVANDGLCTLREATIAANTDTASGTAGGECAAGSGADTITFAANSTITLAGSQLPAVTTEMTITGNGAANTIIQANAAAGTATYRVFEVYTTGNLTLDGVTVRHGVCAGGCAGQGFEGAGIYNNNGTLTVTNSTVSDNSAYNGGGILNDEGTLTMTNSTVSGNTADGSGGGVANFNGTTTVTNSTVSGNLAGFYGGGIDSSDTLTVINSTISGNQAQLGGGIENLDGTTTVTNSTISDNTAETGGGIITRNGTTTVTDSTLSGNVVNFYGGAIVVSSGATTTVTDSTLSGNSAGSIGGGIGVSGTLIVTNSTLSGNSATSDGGGIIILDGSTATVAGSTLSGNSGDRGGGIANGGTLTVTNSTLSGNSAHRGGGIGNGGTVALTNSTLSGNSASAFSGGLYQAVGSMATLVRTLVSGNSAPAGAEIYRSGTINANAFNVFGHSGLTNDEAFQNFTPGASDLTATSDGNATTPLATILNTTLADNGGPTSTHALVAGSPAIDLAPPADCSGAPVNGLDQRGVTRPQGAGCDSGAVEFYALTGQAFVVNDTADTDDGSCEVLVAGISDCTLREAINAANSNPDANDITFDIPATANGCAAANVCTITLAGSQLPAVTTEMTITGNGAANTIIQASTCNPVTLPGGCTPAGNRVIAVTSTGNLTLDGVTVRHGLDAYGGGLHSTGSLTVSNSVVSDNYADSSFFMGAGSGGGIYTVGGTLTLTNVLVAGNRADYYAGGMRTGGVVAVLNSTISGNTAHTSSGGIENWGVLAMVNSSVSDNVAVNAYGGGISNLGTGLILINSTITGNQGLPGGGLYNGDHGATLIRSIISGNTASLFGREIYSVAGQVTANAFNVFGHSGQTNAQAFVGFTPGASDLTATSDGNATTPLAAILNTTLADNGGPTFTHALVAGSPAIDLAPSADCAAAPVYGLDQRGLPRNADGDGAASDNECDAGAYERMPSGSIKVVKTVAGGAPSSAWSFSGTAPIGSFTLAAAGGERTFSDLTTGSFTLTETRQGGWVPSVSCSPGGQTGVAAVTLTLMPNEAAICTFTNTQCRAGSFDNGGAACVPAPAGSFVAAAGATSATLCAPGSWQDQAGQTSCKPADPGYFVPGPGATAQTQCPTGTTSAGGATECTAIPPTSFCPAQDPAVGHARTTLLGRGMGGPTRAIRNVRLNLPNSRKLTGVYAQLARVEVGGMRFVRFTQPRRPVVQLGTPTSRGYQSWAVSWFGADLPPAQWVRGTFFPQTSGTRSPRAFVVWPTYETADTYANVLTPFDDSATNMVYAGWIPVQTQTLRLPPTQADGAVVTVRVALVGVNRDKRQVILTAEAGGVSVRRVITTPTHQEALSLITVTLPGVPAGTDRVTLRLESPAISSAHPFGGDSAAVIGASANYACEMPTR
jgi:CSLREA domain-containing protein